MLSRLSQRAEFRIIVALAFGYPVVGGLLTFLQDRSADPIRISDVDLWWTFGYELTVGSIILGMLWLRGGRWADWRPDPLWFEAWHAIGLFFGAVAAMWLTQSLVLALPGAADRLASSPVEGTPGMVAIIATMLLNPIFEESLYLGYIQTRLREHGPAIAVGAALLVRLLMHLYQGPHAVVTIVPIGLLFGLYVWRTGRVWPSIVAHGLLDLVGLVVMTQA